MINWKFEVEDAACSVDDMKAAERFVQMGWSEGKGKENELEGSGYYDAGWCMAQY